MSLHVSADHTETAPEAAPSQELIESAPEPAPSQELTESAPELAPFQELTESLSIPDGYCSHQIQSVSRSDGGSAPTDNLDSPYCSERQQSLGKLDEPQRQIPSEDPVT